MARTRQAFRNRQDRPIYISVEPWPKGFELEPGDELTLIYDAVETGDAVAIELVNERELVVWPNASTDDLPVLFNGGPSESRNWVFKHP